MDLKFDIECRECGWVFRRRFKKMAHGTYIRCQFCHSSALEIKGDTLIEEYAWQDSFDHFPGDRAVERKFKLD